MSRLFLCDYAKKKPTHRFAAWVGFEVMLYNINR